MARDFDDFPTYDVLVRDNVFLSSIWADFIATFVESLRGYLSQNGIFNPNITMEQRNAIQNPVEGQMVYVTDAVAGPPRTARLQVWQVVADVGQWTTIV